MSDYQARPKIKLADVREYQSANGKQYFSFYLGRTKALMFRDDRAEPAGNAVAHWTLFLEESEPKPQQSAPAQRSSAAGQSRPAAWRPSSAERQSRTAMDRRAEEALRDRGIDPASPIVDDELPL